MRTQEQDDTELNSLEKDILLAKYHYDLACEAYVKNYCPIEPGDLVKIQDESYHNDYVGKIMVVESIRLIDKRTYKQWHFSGCILKKDDSFIRYGKRYSVFCNMGNEEEWLLTETYSERMKNKSEK